MALIRSFVALTLPEEVRNALGNWINLFRKHDTAIRWIPPENLHLTLKFLGNVEESRFENEFFSEIPQLLGDIGPIRLELDKIGRFPLRGIPRIFWLGLKGETEKLQNLVVRLEDFFQNRGFERERRIFAPRKARPLGAANQIAFLGMKLGGKPPSNVFTPHLTLARVKQKPSSGFMRVWSQAVPPEVEPFQAGEVVFFRSELTKEGAVYSELKAFNLDH